LNVQEFLSDPKITFLVRFFLSHPSHPDNAMQVGEGVSWLVCTVESKACLREYDSFIYSYSIDHTDVEIVIRCKCKQLSSIGIDKYQLYTNTISDRKSMSSSNISSYISNTYKEQV